MMMSEVKWLVEPGSFPNEPYLLGTALLDLHKSHVVCKLGHPYESYIRKNDDLVVFHGSKQFAEILRKETNFKVFWNTPQFECRYYYPRFSKHLVNQSYAMMPYGDLCNRREWLYYNFGQDHYKSKDLECFIFLKSDEFKAFSGKLIHWSQWDRDIRQMGLWAEPETMVVVAKPVEIAAEWRLVIANGKIITLSSYKPIKGISALGVKEYAESVLKDVRYAPDPIWVMDIASVKSERHPEDPQAEFYKVLEVGPFSCCGLYECDADVIINTIEEIMS